MSSIGPQLPPHLTKRKRSPEDESPDSPSAKTSRPSNENEISLDDDGSDSEDGYGPSAPKPAAAGPQRPSIGPSLPPTAAAAAQPDSDDDNTGPAPPPQTTAKQQPRRVMGPAPPPADLSTRPTTGPGPGPAPDPDPDPDPDSDSDSEDDYGPALPGTASSRNHHHASPSSLPPPRPEKPARDDWMLAPPEPTGYQERDPTKIKARKFASGGAGASSSSRTPGVSSIWTETPEQKAKRLADAVLGRGGGAADEQKSGSGGNGGGSTKDRAAEQDRIRAFTEQTRGRSLVEEHRAAKKGGAGSGKQVGAEEDGGEEEDDDPSKRAFDREKDMGLGMRITASQRKELLNRASDFGGRFQKGKYL